jgi:hypothetical protein
MKIFIKKLIANINYGLLEKSKNKQQKAFIFNDLSELKHYQSLYGGNLNIISKSEITIDENIEKYISNLDKDVIDDEGALPIGHNVKEIINHDVEHYILNISGESTLKNGFRYIKELLLQRHNFFIHQSYEKLIENNIPVYSVKTDAFTILDSDLEKAKKLLNFESGIGNWRVSKIDKIILPLTDWVMKENHEIPVKKLETKLLDIPDEWDTKAICEQFIKHRIVMTRAEYGGSGKSYNCEYMRKLGYNVLFVCPTRKLVQEIKGNSVTENIVFQLV